MKLAVGRDGTSEETFGGVVVMVGVAVDRREGSENWLEAG